MFNSIIDAASLKNPTILNNFKQRKVTVKYEPESLTAAYHYIFILEIDDDILAAITNIQNEMLNSWYSFFWNETTLYIVFNTKYFKIDMAKDWSPVEYNAAQEFGRTQDIPEVYLDFKREFLIHKEMVVEK